ncbi:MAG: ATP-binding protein [Lachnospira pectinoschiza]
MSRGNNKSSIAAEGTQWYGNIVSSTLQAYYEVYYVNLSDNTCKRIYPWYIEDNEFIDYTNEVNRRISGNIICNNSEEDVSTLLAVDNLKCELKHKDKTEYRYKRQVTNGVFRWCLVSVVVEKRKNGEPVSVILMIRDIEDVIKKEIEQQLLIEEALAQAESASRAKGKFLSDMSHEIRTPMNVILGYASIAQNNMDNRDQDKVKDCLEKIKEAGNHLIGIINDVLEVSRIEQGKINIENEESDIYELMTDFYNLVEIQAAVKKQKMTIDLEGITDKYVYMDWTRISQVLINLINNAIKYTPVGGHIDVIVKEDCNNNIGDNIHNYIIIVKDNGRGIDEKDMPSLFDLYTRGAYDNDISVEGTGLGLSISKQIIELMNGTIDVDSKLGEGTTFTVKLPLQYVVRTQADKNITDNGTDNNIIENDQSLSDIKVMVVDDNQYNREIACELLRENGAHIIECASGSEAVDYIKYKKGIVDIILMDVYADMDGFEATRLIRQLEKDRWQDIPIVAMTANAFDEDRKKALEHGMNGHIAKPFDIDTFAETVLEYVKY